MKSEKIQAGKSSRLSRRNFVKLGGAVIAGAGLKLNPGSGILPDQQEESKIKATKILGRTGFRVSDIAMGTTRIKEANVIRYVYDKGVNYFDTAEGYGGGEAEKLIGQNMQFMDRRKIFITSKIHVNDDESRESILNRFHKCRERLQTDYIDAFFLHNPSSSATLNHKEFHAATDQLKADGKLKYIGLSCHGPRQGRGESMESIMLAAAEDGRFDLMLFIYNFMNRDAGEKILAACKNKNIGTTAMKTSPGVLTLDTVDPDHLTKEQMEFVQHRTNRGDSREAAIDQLRRRAEEQSVTYEKTRPFLEKYNVTTQESLRLKSIQWVLQNPDMHTTCVSFSDFDLVDKVIPMSGTTLSSADHELLEQYRLALDDQYCRHGCSACAKSCPHGLPVSSIMRYAYYYQLQGFEKLAMQKYAGLQANNALLCADCTAPCENACPYHLSVQAQLLQAHSLLTLA
ncbi:MAG: aldo/keto reductase [Candidatus Zhuqueibacterota bacterium]